MSFAKFLRWVLPAFVKRWLGYDQPTRQPEGRSLDRSLADFYAADWIDKLDQAGKDAA